MYTIDQEKLEEVTALYNDEEPSATHHDVMVFICADWHEGPNHQEWLDTASSREIADWIIAAIF